MALPVIHLEYPAWVAPAVDWDHIFNSDEEKMRLAIEMSRLNVVHKTGGPFGAAIFERATGKLVSVGMNSVVRSNNCTMHGEMVAFMMAQARVGSFTLKRNGHSEMELFTSCDPCAMCLGATLWSGVTRAVCGADRDDAFRLKFEEGPVFPQSLTYLTDRGIELQKGFLREEANAVLELYRQNQGVIYNG
jgi:tRNA(Arg) A34 adenosine deaminase TadA